MKMKKLLIIIALLTNSIFAQWEYITPPTLYNGAVDILTANDKLYLLTMNSDLFEYQEANNSWSNLTNGAINDGSFGLFNTSVQIAGENIFVATYDGIYVSPDNGNTWQDDTTGIIRGSHSIKIPFLYTDGTKIFTTRLYPGSGFFVKDALPGAWTRIDDSVIGSSLGGVVTGVCKIEDIYYAVNIYGGFFESNDGINWTSKTTNGLPTSIPFLNGNTNKMTTMGSDILIAAEDGLYKSEDLGSNWTRIDKDFSEFQLLGTVQVRFVHFDGSNLYASVSSDDSAYVSTDRGETWNDISTGLLSTVTSMATFNGALWTTQNIADNPLAIYQSTTSAENVEEIPNEFKLSQNYPNPFNPSTVINYTLPEAANVVLKVYNMLGQEIVTLINQKQNAGNYNAKFDAGNLSSGVYFYSIKTDNFYSIKKMMLMK